MGVVTPSVRLSCLPLWCVLRSLGLKQIRERIRGVFQVQPWTWTNISRIITKSQNNVKPNKVLKKNENTKFEIYLMPGIQSIFSDAWRDYEQVEQHVVYPDPKPGDRCTLCWNLRASNRFCRSSKHISDGQPSHSLPVYVRYNPWHKVKYYLGPFQKSALQQSVEFWIPLYRKCLLLFFKNIKGTFELWFQRILHLKMTIPDSQWFP